MARLDPWEERPIEEANLLNPAFMCALIIEFLKDYSKVQPNGAPITIVTVAMATVLHRDSRERLPNRIITSLYSWLQDNEDILIDFSVRSKNVLPYIKEAIMFGMATETLSNGKGHNISLGIKKISLTKNFLEQTTSEIKSIFDRVKFIGRWLSNSGTESSILAAWGIKP